MAEVLEASRRQAGLTNRELWLGYWELGGTADPGAFEAYLTGHAIPTDGEYDVIAQALNEVFLDAGHNHPVPYAEELSR